MHIQEIREIARNYGLKTGKVTKLDLIREIQRSEGNFDCFATAANQYCDQQDCLWRADCFNAAAKSAIN